MVKRYAVWGVDKTYRFKWMADLVKWWNSKNKQEEYL